MADKTTENLEMFEKISEAVTEEMENVDIHSPENLVFYEAGNMLSSGLKLSLERIREFVDNNLEEVTSDFTKKYAEEEAEDKQYIRMAVLCLHCRRLLLKSIWDAFETNVKDNSFFFRLLTLLTLKADTLPLSHYVTGRLRNQTLFNQVLV